MNVREGQPDFTIGRKSFTAVAINTASKAGEWIKTKIGAYSELKTKKNGRDLVTEVDKGTETLIRKLIHTHFPDHQILGEEGIEPGEDALEKALKATMEAEYVWIVDPIDGTTNFVHGFPVFAVSIALAHKGEIIVGVIYDPNRDEMFVAEKGKGAYVRGRRMYVSDENELGQSLLATGFVPDPAAAEYNMRGFQTILPQARSVRCAGSAAIHMAYVAAGRLSGFWESGLKVWDVAAGVLLVQEAGGKVTDLRGNPYTLETKDILATNGKIHEQISSELVRANAVR